MAPQKTKITIETLVNAPLERAWKLWTDPADIVKWNHASDDWHTPKAQNDLRAGGKFLFRMEAKDGSMGFDFGGQYDQVQLYETIAYTLGDGRKVVVHFQSQGRHTKIETIFEAEEENSLDLQRQGWQAILDQFRKYSEGSVK